MTAPEQPDWQRLKFPDKATYERIYRDYADVVFDEGKQEYKSFHGLPAWIRLGWPSDELWHKAARTEEIKEAEAQRAAGVRVRIPEPWPLARVAWREVMATYPDRAGVPAHEQDALRVVTFWPSVYGEPMIDLRLHVVITINQTHYNVGPHRVPRSVAVALRDIDQRARAEVLKAVMPKNHPDRETVISALTGSAA